LCIDVRRCQMQGDDGLIFCKSRRAAERVRDSITEFIEGELKLKVNREKTECDYIGR